MRDGDDDVGWNGLEGRVGMGSGAKVQERALKNVVLVIERVD